MIKHTTFVGNNDPTHLKGSPTKYTRNDDLTLPSSSESAMVPNVQILNHIWDPCQLCSMANPSKFSTELSTLRTDSDAHNAT